MKRTFKTISWNDSTVLRTVAENRVRWAFWPPGKEPSQSKTSGIWIIDTGDKDPLAHSEKSYLSDDEDDDASDDEEPEKGADRDSDDLSSADGESESNEDAVGGKKFGLTAATSGFSLLTMDEVDDDKSDSDGEEEDSSSEESEK